MILSLAGLITGTLCSVETKSPLITILKSVVSTVIILTSVEDKITLKLLISYKTIKGRLLIYLSKHPSFLLDLFRRYIVKNKTRVPKVLHYFSVIRYPSIIEPICNCLA